LECNGFVPLDIPPHFHRQELVWSPARGISYSFYIVYLYKYIHAMKKTFFAVLLAQVTWAVIAGLIGGVSYGLSRKGKLENVRRNLRAM